MAPIATTVFPGFDLTVAHTGETRWLPRWLELLLLVVLVVAGAAIRIEYTLNNPHFDHESSAGILVTDPALIAYVTDRIVEAGGGVPPDFRADPNIEYPQTCDIPAMFTVGQEFMVAWAKLAVGKDVPLHIVAVWVMSVCASLVAVGVWGIGRELSGSGAWALGAVLVWTALITSYRTLGFIFIREDLSLPLYTLHLWMLLRAARLGTVGAYLGAGMLAVLAAATWHAMRSFLLIEVACMALWFVRSGQNPFASRKSAIALVPVIVLGFSVPVLRAKGFALSAPVVLALALAIAAMSARQRPGRARELILFLVALAMLLCTSVTLAKATASGLYDYVHVFEFLWAKIHYLGVRPDNPNVLSFGTRLLWQGPFETAPASIFILGLGLPLLALVAVAIMTGKCWFTGRGDGRTAVLIAFAVASCFVTWLIQRTCVLTGILASPCTAAILAAVPRRLQLLGATVLLVVVAWQGHLLYSAVLRHNPYWAHPDPTQVIERKHLVDWVQDHLPPGKAIAADLVTGAGLLYHTRRPTLLQPKYETVRSRQRIEAFVQAFYQGTLTELGAWMRSQDCDWLVVNQRHLQDDRYLGGFPFTVRSLEPRHAAAWFLSAMFERIPGFQLVYRSPARFGRDTFRVYRLED